MIMYVAVMPKGMRKETVYKEDQIKIIQIQGCKNTQDKDRTLNQDKDKNPAYLTVSKQIMLKSSRESLN